MRNRSSIALLEEFNDDVSLSVNYLPSKFSPLVTSGLRSRRPGKSRPRDIPIDDSKVKKKMRWNRFKWTLFVANLILTIYSILALIFCLLTWFNIWTHADVIRVANRSELVLSTIASSLSLLASLLGWAGILLNNRSFLAIYLFLLWIAFALLVTPGYIAYHRRTFDLYGKISLQWSRDLGPADRLRVQNQLRCCGYSSPFVEATVSQTCYARSMLPGCVKPYWDFQNDALARWYQIAFMLVPVHLGVIVAGMLCSNHVTNRFGKGMMPKAYRLSEKSTRAVMEMYTRQLADVQGTELAAEILAKSLMEKNSDGSTTTTTLPRIYAPSRKPTPSSLRRQTPAVETQLSPSPPPPPLASQNPRRHSLLSRSPSPTAQQYQPQQKPRSSGRGYNPNSDIDYSHITTSDSKARNGATANSKSQPSSSSHAPQQSSSTRPLGAQSRPAAVSSSLHRPASYKRSSSMHDAPILRDPPRSYSHNGHSDAVHLDRRRGQGLVMRDSPSRSYSYDGHYPEAAYGEGTQQYDPPEEGFGPHPHAGRYPQRSSRQRHPSRGGR